MTRPSKAGQETHVYSNTLTAGALSGFFTRLCCQPLDVLKIRYQLGIHCVNKKNSTFLNRLAYEVKSIVQNEGIQSLWKGHVPAQALSISYGMFQFTAFDWCKSSVKLSPAQNKSYVNEALVNFTAGAVAGCAATIASFPFDTIRTRLVAQTEKLVYKGTLDTFKAVVRQEGVFSLYNGLLSTLVQIAPYVGVQFAVYKLLDSILQTLRPDGYPSQMHFVIGAISGATAKTAVYPLDLIKKHLQMRGANHPLSPHYIETRMRSVLFSVLAKNGYLGLYKGLSLALLKAVMSSGLSFYSYESVLRYISRTKNLDRS